MIVDDGVGESWPRGAITPLVKQLQATLLEHLCNGFLTAVKTKNDLYIILNGIRTYHRKL